MESKIKNLLFSILLFSIFFNLLSVSFSQGLPSGDKVLGLSVGGSPTQLPVLHSVEATDSEIQYSSGKVQPADAVPSPEEYALMAQSESVIWSGLNYDLPLYFVFNQNGVPIALEGMSYTNVDMKDFSIKILASEEERNLFGFISELLSGALAALVPSLPPGIISDLISNNVEVRLYDNGVIQGFLPLKIIGDPIPGRTNSLLGNTVDEYYKVYYSCPVFYLLPDNEGNYHLVYGITHRSGITGESSKQVTMGGQYSTWFTEPVSGKETYITWDFDQPDGEEYDLSYTVNIEQTISEKSSSYQVKVKVDEQIGQVNSVSYQLYKDGTLLNINKLEFLTQGVLYSFARNGSSDGDINAGAGTIYEKTLEDGRGVLQVSNVTGVVSTSRDISEYQSNSEVTQIKLSYLLPDETHSLNLVLNIPGKFSIEEMEGLTLENIIELLNEEGVNGSIHMIHLNDEDAPIYTISFNNNGLVFSRYQFRFRYQFSGDVGVETVENKFEGFIPEDVNISSLFSALLHSSSPEDFLEDKKESFLFSKTQEREITLSYDPSDPEMISEKVVKTTITEGEKVTEAEETFSSPEQDPNNPNLVTYDVEREYTVEDSQGVIAKGYANFEAECQIVTAPRGKEIIPIKMKVPLVGIGEKMPILREIRFREKKFYEFMNIVLFNQILTDLGREGRLGLFKEYDISNVQDPQTVDLKSFDLSQLKNNLIKLSLWGIDLNNTIPQVQEITSIEKDLSGEYNFILKNAVLYDVPLLKNFLNQVGLDIADLKDPQGNIIIDFNKFADQIRSIVGEAGTGDISLLAQFNDLWEGYIQMLKADLLRKGYEIEIDNSQDIPILKIKSTSLDKNRISKKIKIDNIDENERSITIKEYTNNDELLSVRKLTFTNLPPGEFELFRFIGLFYIYERATSGTASPRFKWQSVVGKLEKEEYIDNTGKIRYVKYYQDDVLGELTKIDLYDYSGGNPKIITYEKQGGGFSTADGVSDEIKYVRELFGLISENGAISTILQEFSEYPGENWQQFSRSLEEQGLRVKYDSDADAMGYGVYSSLIDGSDELLFSYKETANNLIITFNLDAFHSDGYEHTLKMRFKKEDGGLLLEDVVWTDNISWSGESSGASRIIYKYNGNEHIENTPSAIAEFLRGREFFNNISVLNVIEAGYIPEHSGIYLDILGGENEDQVVNPVVSSLVESLKAIVQYISTYNFRRTIEELKEKNPEMFEGLYKEYNRIFDTVTSGIFTGLGAVGDFITGIVNTLTGSEDESGDVVSRPDRGTLFQIPRHKFYLVTTKVIFNPEDGMTDIRAIPPYGDFNKSTFQDFESFEKWADSLIGNLIESKDKIELYEYLWNIYKLKDKNGNDLHLTYTDTEGNTVWVRDLDPIYFYILLRGEDYLETFKAAGRGLDNEQLLQEYWGKIAALSPDYLEVIKRLTYPQYPEDNWLSKDGQVGAELKYFDFTWKHILLAGGITLSLVSPLWLEDLLATVFTPGTFVVLPGAMVPSEYVAAGIMGIIGAFRGATMFIPFTTMMMSGKMSGDFLDYLNTLDDMYLTNTIYSLVFGAIFNPSMIGLKIGIEPGNLLSYPFRFISRVLAPKLGETHWFLKTVRTIGNIFGYGDWVSSGFLRAGAWIGRRVPFLSSYAGPSMGNIGFWAYNYVAESFLEEQLQPGSMHYGLKYHGSKIVPQAIGPKSTATLIQYVLRCSETFGNFSEMSDPLESPFGLLLLPSMIGWSSQFPFIELIGLQHSQ